MNETTIGAWCNTEPLFGVTMVMLGLSSTMLLQPAAPLGTALSGLLLVRMNGRMVIVISGMACILGAAFV